MYIELGDYDPSNEYVANYSGPKIIRLYQKLTEKRINAETLYLQISNQLKIGETGITLDNTTTHHFLKNYRIKTLTVNVNRLNNYSKRKKNFNFLKTNKIDITLFLETYSTKTAEKPWQKV